MSPSRAVAEFALDCSVTVPRPPSHPATRAHTVPARMRMRTREGPGPAFASRTVTSEPGSTTTVVPSRKVISARPPGEVTTRSPSARSDPLVARASGPPVARACATGAESTVSVAAVTGRIDGDCADTAVTNGRTNRRTTTRATAPTTFRSAMALGTSSDVDMTPREGARHVPVLRGGYVPSASPFPRAIPRPRAGKTPRRAGRRRQAARWRSRCV